MQAKLAGGALVGQEEKAHRGKTMHQRPPSVDEMNNHRHCRGQSRQQESRLKNVNP